MLVDAGWDRGGGLEGLDVSLRTFGSRLEDVRGVLFTHAHHDHYAVGDLVREASGAWLALHEDESDVLAPGGEAVPDAGRLDGHFLALGLPPDERREMVEVSLWMWGARAGFEPDRRLRDGETAAAGDLRLRVLHTPGHSPGHACYVAAERGVVFTGDHVLSRTTPNVGIYAGSRGSPLDDYLTALHATQALGGLVALPGHEERVAVATRSAELLAHHERQLLNAARLVAAGRGTVREAAEEMEWTTPWPKLGRLDRHLALAETHAHLVALERRGVVERLSERPLRWVPARS